MKVYYADVVMVLLLVTNPLQKWNVLLIFHRNILVSIFVVEAHIFLQNVSSTVHLHMVQILKSRNNINTESL
jgi:uncharacterized paraquat-inducible protein A